MEKTKNLALSNSLENMLFPPGKYTSTQLLNLTPYFTSTLTLQKHKENMSKIFESDQEKLWYVVRAQNGQVDAKALLLILMLQLIGREKRQHAGFNENAKHHGTTSNSQTTTSNMTSPRNRTTRALYISNQQTLIMNYVKQNITNFLRLLSNEPKNQDPFLSAQDLQPLSILFKIDRKKPFSNNLSIFNNTQKLKASTIGQHIAPRITISDTQLLSLEGNSYSVIIKQQIHCHGKDLRIIGCEDSQIFIQSSVNSLYMVNCINCTIYVAACEKIAFIDKCQKISLTIAANLLRICNTIDSMIYYYGPSPVIMTGDNRSVCLGPNNSPSAQLKQHIKSANITISKEFEKNYQQVLYKAATNPNSYFIMKPQDFDLLVLPHKQQQQDPLTKTNQSTLTKNLVAPLQFIKELENRNSYYSSFKSKISKNNNLSADMIKHLHSAYQGHFKEWLVAKGYNKNLNDLVKMLDK